MRKDKKDELVEVLQKYQQTQYDIHNYKALQALSNPLAGTLLQVE